MKSALVVLCVLTVVYGNPISSTNRIHSKTQMNEQTISDSAMFLESVSHMAVVDMFSPLLSTLSSLDAQLSKLQNYAVQVGVGIPRVAIPKLDMTIIFKCQARSEPKYSPALLYLMSKRNEIKHHIDTATMIAHGIEYINKLLVNDVIDEKTLQAMSSKLGDFLSGYSSLITGLQKSVCTDENFQSSENMVQDRTESYIDPALDIFHSDNGESVSIHKDKTGDRD